VLDAVEAPCPVEGVQAVLADTRRKAIYVVYAALRSIAYCVDAIYLSVAGRELVDTELRECCMGATTRTVVAVRGSPYAIVREPQLTPEREVI